ncbi:MAG: alpha/beta fold hydrolase [Clostridia bacterium]|nr:alpha/beta fold hydrolase [Clostridia bacterium]
MTFTIVKKTVPSTDGKNTLHGIMYVPDGEIRGIFHLVHGMTEYIGRYAPLFEQIASAGYLCAGFDNLGHGNTAKTGDLGFIASKDGDKYLIDDVKAFADSLKSAYPNLPYYLMGHSMGSFITRLAVTKYPNLADKYICCGTGGKNAAAGMGLLLCKIIKLFRGERAISPFIEAMAFGSYNKRFDGPTKYEWLTKDRDMIARYEKNEFCKFHFTVSAMHDLIKLNKDSNSTRWFKEVKQGLPILLVAGDMDPVGNYGKGVKQVYDRLKAAQKNDVTLFLYENCRHEIHNDTCKEQFTEDLLRFIAK